MKEASGGSHAAKATALNLTPGLETFWGVSVPWMTSWYPSIFILLRFWLSRTSRLSITILLMPPWRPGFVINGVTCYPKNYQRGLKKAMMTRKRYQLSEGYNVVVSVVPLRQIFQSLFTSLFSCLPRSSKLSKYWWYCLRISWSLNWLFYWSLLWRLRTSFWLLQKRIRNIVHELQERVAKVSAAIKRWQSSHCGKKKAHRFQKDLQAKQLRLEKASMI